MIPHGSAFVLNGLADEVTIWLEMTRQVLLSGEARSRFTPLSMQLPGGWPGLNLAPHRFTKGDSSMRTVTTINRMRQFGTLALVLSFGAASVYAQEVKMTFSGTTGASAINLQQTNTSTGEDNFAGGGTLGQFTFRNVTSETLFPQTPPDSCATQNNLYFLRVAGAGVLRFQDGSLLQVTMLTGADCVDLQAGNAHCTLSLQITGGTGRFKNATGALTMTEIVVPVLFDALNNPAFFAATGELTGTISGVSGGSHAQGNENGQ